MNKNRVGIFEISRIWIDDYPYELIETFHKLGIIVVRCEMLYHKDCLEYVALSNFFREIKQGEITPRYEIITMKAGTPDWNVKVQEIK